MKNMNKISKNLNNLPCVNNLKSEDLRGKRILLRVDFNVPISENHVVENGNTWRIDKILPTIEFLQESKAKIILLSHIGRGGDESLRPVFEYLQTKSKKIGFVPNTQKGELPNIIETMKEGSVIMLENLRQDPREEKNDKSFAEELAKFGDIYINEAFAVSHREHASLVSLPKLLPSYVGLQFKKEVENLSSFLNPEKPFGLIVGGAKLPTKVPLLEKFIDIADWIIPGGVLANTILNRKGCDVGVSRIDKKIDISSLVNNKKILIPKYYLTKLGEIKECGTLDKKDVIYDIAPISFEEFEDKILKAKSVLWNGPLGFYEENFTEGSIELINIISESSAFSVAGGGDTISLIAQNNFEDKFDFVSTGGGAMLDFLVDGSLPGIDVMF